LADYAQNFTAAGGKRYAGETTPGYFWSYDPDSRYCGMDPQTSNTAVPEAVKETLGTDVRLILSLRNPVHRAVSAYLHHFKRQRVAPEERLFDVGKKSGIIDMGFYRRHLEHWEAVFGPDKIDTVFLEDIEADGDAVLSGLFTRLGLPPVAVAGADESEHVGLQLRVKGQALVIDREGAHNQKLLRRMGLETGELPKIREKELQMLFEVYQKDIEYVMARFNRPDLGWDLPPKLEDFASAS
jgi:hypothetical protein